MILFLADGRLGNQLFQYAFLKTIAKENEKIVVSGFEELEKVFEINDILNISKKGRLLRIFLFRIVKPFFNYLSSKDIISTVSINYEKVLDKYLREGTTFSHKIGNAKKITFVKLGFFQSEVFFEKEIINKLIIKGFYLDQANKVMKEISTDNHKVFIHIRRGDYKDYKIYGKETILPIVYYKNLIEWFLKNKKDCFFIFLSDDTDFIEKEFEYVKNKLISINNHFGVDLAIMTLCNSAILSPSSFGWWGSYLMKQRDTVFAPKYWQGFNSNCDLHSLPLASFMKEVDICAEY